MLTDDEVKRAQRHWAETFEPPANATQAEIEAARAAHNAKFATAARADGFFVPDAPEASAPIPDRWGRP